jgi:hypothetical protein
VQYGGETRLRVIESRSSIRSITKEAENGVAGLRNVCVRVRDCLLSRVMPLGSLKAEQFVVDALCAACMSFLPEIISKSN